MITSSRLRAWALVVAVVTGSFVATASAQSPNDQQARNHFLAGTSYYEQARYDMALAEFLEAFRLSGRVELLINASRAAERNLDFTQAIALVDQFLAAAPADHAQRQSETARRESLVQLQARMGSQPPRTTTTTTSTTTASDEPEAAEEPRRRMGTLGYVGIGALGGGVAFGVVSLATGLVANSRYGDLEDSCPGGACGPGDADTISGGRRLARLSTATTFIGVGAAVAGVVLMIVDPGREPDAAPTAAPRITPGPGDAGLGLGWSF